jgi:hypothetical protein
VTSLDNLRDINGVLPAYAWPGGYPLYYVTADCLTVCPDCANKDDTSDPATAYGTHWEGPAIECDDCGRPIESAYGDPDEAEAEVSNS